MTLTSLRLFCLFALLNSCLTWAQDSNLTYQGQLRDGGQPVTGTVNLEFRLFDQLTGGAQIGAPQTRLNWPVEDGLFQVDLDFGSTAFDGSPRFFEVRVNGAPLTPRQRVAPAPAALIARDVTPGSIGIEDIDPTSFRNLLPVAWGWVQTGSLNIEGFGIQSISSPSTGTYQITLAEPVSGRPAIIATAFTRVGNAEIVGYDADSNSNVITIKVYDGSDGTTLKNSDFSFVVYDN